MQYSAKLCATIGAETGQDVGFHKVGSIRLASSDARWEELKRNAAAANSCGLDVELIGPAEIKDKFPLVDLQGVRGATWIASDGYVDPYSLTMAYAKGARAGGVKIVEGVTVTGFRQANGRITHVLTDRGDVACEIAVNAAGLWARHVGEMAGLELPVTVLEHQYLVTEKSPLIPDKLPTLRDPDLNFYLKSEPGAFAIGGWEEGTVAVYGSGKLPMDFGQELFAQNLDRLEVIAGPAAERIPVLNQVGIRTVINGPIPVSADGEPVIGIADGIENLFIACGFTSGIAASAGAGFAVANWIATGDPGMDLEGFALSRFAGRRYNPEDLCAAAIRAYAAYYALSGVKIAPAGAGGCVRKLGKLRGNSCGCHPPEASVPGLKSITRGRSNSMLKRSLALLGAAALAAILAVAPASAQRTKLTVYTAIENDQLGPFKQAIEAAVPDVEIVWVRDSTGVITARFLAEKDNPRADVVLGLAVTSLIAFEKAGLLETYEPKGASALKPRVPRCRRALHLDRHGRLSLGAVLQHRGRQEEQRRDADVVAGHHQSRLQGQDRHAASGLVRHRLSHHRGLDAADGREGRLGVHGQAARQHRGLHALGLRALRAGRQGRAHGRHRLRHARRAREDPGRADRHRAAEGRRGLGA